MKKLFKFIGFVLTEGPFEVFSIKGIPLVLSSAIVLFFTTLCSLQLFLDSFSVAVDTATSLLLLYFALVVHEYGHGLTALHFGYRPKNIILFPFAGACQIPGTWHRHSRREFWITINGPLTNIIMGALFAPLVYLFPDNEWIAFWVRLNFVFAMFNFLPVYPMDGGRLFRSFANYLTGDWWRATIITQRVAIAFSIIAIPFLYSYVGLIAALLVGFMGLVGATAEKKALEMDHLLTTARSLDRGHREDVKKAIKDMPLPKFENEEQAKAYEVSTDAFVDFFTRCEILIRKREIYNGKIENKSDKEIAEECAEKMKVVHNQILQSGAFYTEFSNAFVLKDEWAKDICCYRFVTYVLEAEGFYDDEEEDEDDGYAFSTFTYKPKKITQKELDDAQKKLKEIRKAKRENG